MGTPDSGYATQDEPGLAAATEGPKTRKVRSSTRVQRTPEGRAASPWAEPHAQSPFLAAAAAEEDALVEGDLVGSEGQTEPGTLLARPMASRSSWRTRTAFHSLVFVATGLVFGVCGLIAALDLGGRAPLLEGAGHVGSRVILAVFCLVMALVLVVLGLRLWRPGVYLYDDRLEAKYLFRSKSIDRDRVRKASAASQKRPYSMSVGSREHHWVTVTTAPDPDADFADTDTESTDLWMGAMLNTRRDAKHIANRINRWSR